MKLTHTTKNTQIIHARVAALLQLLSEHPDLQAFKPKIDRQHSRVLLTSFSPCEVGIVLRSDISRNQSYGNITFFLLENGNEKNYGKTSATVKTPRLPNEIARGIVHHADHYTDLARCLSQLKDSLSEHNISTDGCIKSSFRLFEGQVTRKNRPLTLSYTKYSMDILA